MADSSDKGDLRLVRFLAPGPLLREVDELVIQGRGGYQTRQEFFLDAIQNQILEVKYGATEHGQARLNLDELPGPSQPPQDEPAEPKGDEPAPVAPALANGAPVDVFEDFSPTKLPVPPPGPRLEDGLAVVRDEPLFGLHNRDYPSIWTAQQLATQTEDGPVPLQEYLTKTTQEAWRFAAALQELENGSKSKLTALFPKNAEKPQSAEVNFKAFAIGSLAKTVREDGYLNASGPLYAWRLAQVTRREGKLLIGLTLLGQTFLEQMAGISLQLPHEPEYAERFLAFLRQHAEADATGFERLLEFVPEGLKRVELAQRFNQWRPDWSHAEANTHAAAFVARGREWGLLEPKLIEGRYALTEFGEQQRTRVAV